MKIKEVTGDYSMSGTRRMQAPGNLRSGFATRGSRSSLEKDLEDIEWKERQDRVAASIVYLQHEGKILAETEAVLKNPEYACNHIVLIWNEDYNLEITSRKESAYWPRRSVFGSTHFAIPSCEDFNSPENLFTLKK